MIKVKQKHYTGSIGVYVNIDYIERIYPSTAKSERSECFIGTDSDTVHVLDSTVDDVYIKIKEARKIRHERG